MEGFGTQKAKDPTIKIKNKTHVTGKGRRRVTSYKSITTIKRTVPPEKQYDLKWKKYLTDFLKLEKRYYYIWMTRACRIAEESTNRGNVSSKTHTKNNSALRLSKDMKTIPICRNTLVSTEIGMY